MNNQNHFFETEKSMLTGQVEGIIFAAQDSFYKVLAVTIEDKNFDYDADEMTITGSFGELQIGATYEFVGRVTSHARFGEQFSAQQYKRLAASSSVGLVKYLSSSDFDGIGEKTAEKIVDALGINAIDVILDSPDQLATLGLSFKQQKTIVTQLKQANGMERAIIALNDYGFSANLAAQIYAKYGNATLDILHDNPYQLVIDIEGVSFTRVDQLAMQSGMSALDERRVQAGLIAALNRATFENGDTYITIEQLCIVTIRLLEQAQNVRIDMSLVKQAILGMTQAGYLIADDNRIFMADIYLSEVQIAQKIIELNTQIGQFKRAEVVQALNAAEKDNPFPYAEEQQEAMIAALTNKLFILTGGPGTGKTTIINGVVAAFQHLMQKAGWTEKKINAAIKLVAPTGRAAKRLSEATGMPASTIHRLLGITGREKMADLDIDNIEGQLLIVDEMSMVDTELFSILLSATPQNMQVILVGDKDQLPSVGPGQVFSDLLASGKLNFRELELIHRQGDGSSIVTLANEVKHGTLPDDLMQQQNDRAFFAGHVGQVADAIEKIVKSWIAHGNSAADMQILSPMYRTDAGVNQLNLIAQNLFNPLKAKSREMRWREGDFEFGFRVGDKVMQKTNDPENNVFNGDIGYITTILFAKDKQNTEKSDVIEVDFEAQHVTYQRSEFMNLTLAYATTIHKAQGGEYDLVILPLVRQFNRMLQRNLLYTGLTRARKSLVLIGEPDAFQAAAQTQGAVRKTMLPVRLSAAIDGVLPKMPTVAEMTKEVVQNDDASNLVESSQSDTTFETVENEEKIERLTVEKIMAATIEPNIGMADLTPADFM
ncbi:ATP-dependent RecD-like DNA helicase [Weissella diestrammenae]|uniref:ATP-dependent RecD2 DNA helicase n=1 Tax=Weissella diestrammenae TaxID=1162633 RepID=A0A7G9T5R8_9LACO|nr:ATP-dependent RecD-like DNA helicase [Weissella diestrammenae]MCM0582271.1 ATP-dependent RecD-like DNA helicase [Weissella diestrammenae]QNN75443.1 ATP-dependent RecD-like DNA helicase [Weissella diestrammenae]